MYSTNIENNRCFVDCIIVSNEIAVEKFVVDTGAMYTCCYGGVVDENLEENALKDRENRYIGGLVKGDAVKFYRYPLKQFTIGISLPVFSIVRFSRHRHSHCSACVCGTAFSEKYSAEFYQI